MKIRRTIEPKYYALFIALAYFLTAGTYVLISSQFAGGAAATVEDLERLEIAKGLAFVLVTAAFIFAFTLAAFRRMARDTSNLLQSRQALLISERRAVGALVAASISHDFNNLLAILRLNTERIKMEPGLSPVGYETVARLERGVQRLTDLVQRLRNAEHNTLSERPQPFEVVATVVESLDFLRSHPTVQGCHLDFQHDTEIPMVGFPIVIHQMMINLVLNAAEAMEGRGRILIRVFREGDSAILEVHDNGPGVAETLRESIFEAFFTTKGSGSGLGLVSVKVGAELNGGAVEVRSSPLGGACFRIVLPNGRRAAVESHGPINPIEA